MDVGIFGCLAVVAAVAELVFAAFVFTFVKRLLRRPPTPIGEEVGAFRRVLGKLRRGEPMSREELDLAAQTIADRGSLLAYSIPAAVFTAGCFIAFSAIELHGMRSLRIYIGLFPMLGATNMTIQLLRIARLKRRLRDACRDADGPPGEALSRTAPRTA